MTKTIFITGASSGLGKASALYFAQQGWDVAATMRSPEKETELAQYKNIRVLKLDVTDAEQVRKATQEAVKAFVKIDVVLNNAGVGVYGALELAKEEDIDWQIATNVRGPINIIRSFLPHFRSSDGGMFINVSSYMGLTTAAPLASLYNLSKFALEGLTEALYYELKPLNIDLRLIEQGGSTDNNFMNNMRWSTHPEIKDYDALTAKLRHRFETAGDDVKDKTSDIVSVIADLAERRNNRFRNVIGNSGNALMAMRNSMPIEEYLEKINSLFNSIHVGKLIPVSI